MSNGNPWDFTGWGTYLDPIHKSDLSSIVGQYGCSEQFRRKKNARALDPSMPKKAGGKLITGNAGHAVIARILRAPLACQAALTPGYSFAAESIKEAFQEEYERLRAGRPVEWYKTNPEKWLAEQIKMIGGLMDDIRARLGI